MKPSTLNSHLKSYNIDIITDAIFLAEASNDKFAEVNILTQKAHLTNIAMEGNSQILPNITKIQQLVEQELKNEKLKDFVEITKNEIRVVIDCKLITDDIVAKAFKMLACIETFTPGTKIEFSKGSQIYDNPYTCSSRTH